MITIRVYPVDTIHGFLVWLFGSWTRRVNWHLIHWTIEVQVDELVQEYHLTGSGVSIEPMRSKPIREWKFPCTRQETYEVIERIQAVVDAKYICSYESLFEALVKPVYPRVDTCLSFVLYCWIGSPMALGNYPLEFAVTLSEMEEMYEEYNVRQG